MDIGILNSGQVFFYVAAFLEVLVLKCFHFAYGNVTDPEKLSGGCWNFISLQKCFLNFHVKTRN